jgi:hypothetical protein
MNKDQNKFFNNVTPLSKSSEYFFKLKECFIKASLCFITGEFYSRRLHYSKLTINVIKALIQETKRAPLIKEHTFRQDDIMHSLGPALLND